ncbi:LacI family DNA-binding transcriptional regulator, partial [Actinacidiphila acidipaludis]
TDGYGRWDGAAAMNALLDRGERPDAVFAYNDLMALGAMRALVERGLRVPQDISVVGFDDVEEGRFSTIALTTVSPDKQAIARLAVERVVARLTGAPDMRPERIQPGYTLIARESSSPPVA